jgi:hypothetical protein
VVTDTLSNEDVELKITVFSMQQAIATTTDGINIPPATLAFYRDILQILQEASLPCMVGGAYALHHYTGIDRLTRDFDIFIAREDYEIISRTLDDAGYRTELVYPPLAGESVRRR